MTDTSRRKAGVLTPRRQHFAASDIKMCEKALMVNPKHRIPESIDPELRTKYERSMQSYKLQRIRDPLHNLIEFRADEFEDAMWCVLNTRPFQRLRRIKQLGFSDLVYPGATHSRFAHSVGVFHTARQLMGIVEEQLGQYGSHSFKKSLADRALAAALVHDLGHGPFSHAFEEVGKRLKLKMARHETVSDAIIRDSEVTAALNKLGEGFANGVAKVIGSKGPSDIYGAVVSSQFDADRLDYMQRDRLMSGTQHGVIDFAWLVANLRVGKLAAGVDETKLGDVETFVLGPKAIYAAESYVLGLFQLYPTIYFHKTTRGAEKIFTELLCRTIQLIQNGNGAFTGLSDTHPISTFAKNPDLLENALSLDDTVIWGAIYQMVDAEDGAIATFAKRLRDRNLYKSLNVREQILSYLPQGDSKDKLTLVNRVCVSVREKIKVWSEEKSGDTPRILYDEATRSPYNMLDDSKGPFNQIHIETPSRKLVDLGDRSAAVKAIDTFRLFRAYVAAEDDEACEFVRSAIKEEAENADRS